MKKLSPIIIIIIALLDCKFANLGNCSTSDSKAPRTLSELPKLPQEIIEKLSELPEPDKQNFRITLRNLMMLQDEGLTARSEENLEQKMTKFVLERTLHNSLEQATKTARKTKKKNRGDLAETLQALQAELKEENYKNSPLNVQAGKLFFEVGSLYYDDTSKAQEFFGEAYTQFSKGFKRNSQQPSENSLMFALVSAELGRAQEAIKLFKKAFKNRENANAHPYAYAIYSWVRYENKTFWKKRALEQYNSAKQIASQAEEEMSASHKRTLEYKMYSRLKVSQITEDPYIC